MSSSSNSQHQRRQEDRRSRTRTTRRRGAPAPAPAPASSSTVVSFHPRVAIYVTISNFDITPRERADCWHTKSELAAVQDENVKRITQYRSSRRKQTKRRQQQQQERSKGHEDREQDRDDYDYDYYNDDNDEEWSIRGLEHVMDMKSFQSRKNARDDVVRAVLRGQAEGRRKMMTEEGASESSRLALSPSRLWRSLAVASISATEPSRRLATRAGRRDAEVASRLWSNSSNKEDEPSPRRREQAQQRRAAATPSSQAPAAPRRIRHRHRQAGPPPPSLNQDLLDQVDAILDQTAANDGDGTAAADKSGGKSSSSTSSAPSVMESLPFLSSPATSGMPPSFPSFGLGHAMGAPLPPHHHGPRGNNDGQDGQSSGSGAPPDLVAARVRALLAGSNQQKRRTGTGSSSKSEPYLSGGRQGFRLAGGGNKQVGPPGGSGDMNRTRLRDMLVTNDSRR